MRKIINDTEMDRVNQFKENHAHSTAFTLMMVDNFGQQKLYIQCKECRKATDITDDPAVLRRTIEDIIKEG